MLGKTVHCQRIKIDRMGDGKMRQSHYEKAKLKRKKECVKIKGKRN